MNGRRESRGNCIKFPVDYHSLKIRPASLEDGDIISIGELSTMFRISESAVYKRLEREQLPGHLISGKWIVLRSELYGFIAGK